MKQRYVLCAGKEGFHRIAYTEWGDANTATASTVVCVHGLTRNSRDFDSLANFLSTKGHHVFCPDVVGRGDSSWLKNSNDYTFKRYVMDMNNILSRTGANQIDWIGTSMGGIIGMIIASLPNSPIRRLILNDVSPQVPTHALWRMAKYVGREPEFNSKEQAKRHYQRIYAEFGHLTETQWDFFTEHSIMEKAPGVFISKYDPAIHDFRFKLHSVKDFVFHPHKALEGVFFDIDLWSYWQNITCPVLVIRGRNSDLLLPEHIKKMKRIHSQVEVYEIDNAGHAPALLNFPEQEKIAMWLNNI